MRSSAIIAGLCATMAIASPPHQGFHKKALEKKAIEWEFVTEVVTVTVTAGHLPSSSPDSLKTKVVQHTVYVNPVAEEKPAPTPSTSSSSTPPPPPPASTPSTTPLPAPATFQEVTPAPTTQAAPVVEVKTQPAPAAPAPPSDLSGAAKVGVDNHNSCRSKHSAGRMTWNETLAGYAAITALNCNMVHDMSQGGGGYGQNLASQGSTQSDAWTVESSLEDSINNQWYSELNAFSQAGLFGNPSPPSKVGSTDVLHFTQVVWKDSTNVGCAVRACGPNTVFPNDSAGRQYYAWYTVCNYYPAGNMMGAFAENVSAN